MTRVLGVDPGSLTTGWGLIEARPGRVTLVRSDVIRLSTERSFPRRLHRLRGEFERLVDELRPDAAAVETPFHGINARAALQLAHARGVLLAVLGGAGIPVEEYTPATVKKAVAMTGRADKRQVQTMVATLLRLDEPLRQPDLADALAVALCHSNRLGLGAAGAGAGPRHGAASRRAWTRKLDANR